MNPGHSLHTWGWQAKVIRTEDGWALEFNTQAPPTFWQRLRGLPGRWHTARLELTKLQIQQLHGLAVDGEWREQDEYRPQKSPLEQAIKAARGGEPPGPTYGYA